MALAFINLELARGLLRQSRDAISITMATHAVRDALSAANKAGDARLKAACLRILHMLRLATKQQGASA